MLISKTKVSFYQSAKESTSQQTENLFSIILGILTGRYKDQVQNLRNQTTPEAYKLEKLKGCE